MLNMITQLLFRAGNQGNHQDFDPFLLLKKLWLIFMSMNQKKKFSIPPILKIFLRKFQELVFGFVKLIDVMDIYHSDRIS